MQGVRTGSRGPRCRVCKRSVAGITWEASAGCKGSQAEICREKHSQVEIARGKCLEVWWFVGEFWLLVTFTCRLAVLRSFAGNNLHSTDQDNFTCVAGVVRSFAGGTCLLEALEKTRSDESSDQLDEIGEDWVR